MTDFFAALGMPVACELDRHQLDANYRQRQAEWHPDRYVSASEAVKLQALRHTSLLNDAYTTLKQPLRRAEHLLELKDSDAAGHSSRKLEPAFLLQQLEQREVFHSPDAIRHYLQLHLAHKSHEVFAVLFLDNQNRLLAMEELFRGTLSQTSVYPREVVMRALHHQAASVVLSHNHPSGSVQPSRADEHLTQTLKASLALVDVRVLDHIFVGQGQSFSMAEQGQL